jgi:hypothetical protein
LRGLARRNHTHLGVHRLETGDIASVLDIRFLGELWSVPIG